MSLFICWSGSRSHELAKAMRTLLERTLSPPLGAGDIFVSDSIGKGTTWFDSILGELERAVAGIVCVTAENVGSPWMHFEAGALARRLSALPAADVVGSGVGTGPSQLPPMAIEQSSASSSGHRSRLFTVLHGVSPEQVTGPLNAYQGTATTRRELAELIRELRLVLDPDATVETTTPATIDDQVWDAFECAVGRIFVPARDLVDRFDGLFQRKTFNEPLPQCADQAWLARYEGARITRETLLPYVARIKAASPPHEPGLFDMLLAELDSYGMAIQSLLLTPRAFPLGTSGELAIDTGIVTCCEDRRLAIRSLVGHLLHPMDAPLLSAAVRFMAAESNEERRMIVHRLEGRIRHEREETYEDVSKGATGRGTIDEAIARLALDMLRIQAERQRTDEDEELPTLRLLRFRESSWDLDRIYYYLLVQYFDVFALRWESDATALTPKKTHGAGSASADPEPLVAGPVEHDLFCAARDVEMEIERYGARSKGGSLLPLTYALIALGSLRPKQMPDALLGHASVAAAVALVEAELSEELKTDAGRPVARLLSALK